MKNLFPSNIVSPTYNKNGVFLRKIQSFKCRNRLLTNQMMNMLKNYFEFFGINFTNQYISLDNIFRFKYAPIILEVGFGNGEYLFNTAVNYHQYNILGIEVYIKGVSNLINKIHISGLKINNLKIIIHDAVEVFQFMIKNNSINVIQFFFPDPWPKLRHHKRRILQKSFIKLILKKLVNSGILHIVTDCPLYMNHIVNIMNNIKNIINVSNMIPTEYILHPKIMTNFERKAFLKKNRIFNLIFQYFK